MGRIRSESETIFRWNEDEPIVHLFSASPVVWRRLARLGIRPTRETTKGGKPSGKFYEVSLDRFRWRIRPVERRRPRPGNLEALRKARLARRRVEKSQSTEAQDPRDVSG